MKNSVRLLRAALVFATCLLGWATAAHALTTPGTGAIAAGGAHVIALKADGTVWTWGVDNSMGQLGDGTTVPRLAPAQVSGLTNVVAVAAGNSHSVALKSDGTVWTWGSNSSGQLGDGTTTQRTTPVQIGSLSGVIAIAAGSIHTVALKSDGTVWAWGYNAYGRLGDGTTTQRTSPVQVSGLANVVTVSAGGAHTIATIGDGTVWAWGSNSSGQLGDGTTTQRTTPVQVSGLTGMATVVAGSLFSAALKNDGTVWAWGANSSGQLGDGTTTQRNTPVQVSNLTGAVMVTAGGNHMAALKNDGTLWAWGLNYYGQLGDGTVTDRTSPVQVTGLGAVAVVAAGGTYTAAIYNDGTVHLWNRLPPSYMIVQGPPAITLPPWIGWTTPVQVGGLTSMVAVAARSQNTVAAGSDGRVLSWGAGFSPVILGQNGPPLITPLAVSDLTGGTAVGVGGYHAVVLKNDGTVWTWGSNSNGQLGDGTTTQRTTPVQVSGLSGMSMVAAGNAHTMALKSDGTVWTWGSNSNGQLGDGTTTQRTAPVQVSGLTGIVAVAAGDVHTVAVKSDGTVWTWGNNFNGQLGDGTTTQRTSPVQVASLSGVVRVAAGGGHTVAVKTDGTVMAWGQNFQGQLGDGTTTQRNTPVQVSGLTDVVTMSAGGMHTVAVKSDGTIQAWGNNYSSQLGIWLLPKVQGIPIRLTVSSTDTDQDGMPDAWETQYFGSLGHNGLADGDLDGLNDIQEFLHGSDPTVPDFDADRLTDIADPYPTDYYNNIAPTLTIVGGNNQSGTVGQFNAQPFDVAVWNAGGTAPLVNAPVAFTVLSGGGLLAATNVGNPTLATSLPRLSDQDGTVQGYYQQPAGYGITSQVRATAGLSQVTLQTTSVPVDTDADGLADVWEQQYLGSLNYGPNDDPGGIGRTLLQSFQQGLSPWPSPVVASGLRAWYRADLGLTKDDNNKVSRWLDVSGQGSHVENTGNSAYQPVAVSAAMNGNPAVAFNAADYTSLGTAGAVDLQAGQSDLTVLVVLAAGTTQGGRSQVLGMSYEISEPDSGFGLFQYWGEINQFKLSWRNVAKDTIRYGPGTNLTPGQVQVFSVRKAGTTATAYLDGVLQGTETVGADMWTPAKRFMLGAGLNGADPFTGHIAEVLVYNRALSATEREQIEASLAAKYIAADSDNDGLPDVWERQHLGTLNHGPTDDPGNVGRTLQQSYNQGQSPWPAPVVAAGLQAWYRADLGVTKDGSDKVGQWLDVSGHGRHVTNGGSTDYRPVAVASAMNGLPAVEFAASSYTSLGTPGPVDLQAGQTDLTVLVVLATGATQGGRAQVLGLSYDSNVPESGFSIFQYWGEINQFKLSWRNAARDTILYGPGTNLNPGQVQVLSVQKSGTNATAYLDGVLQGTETLGADMWTPLRRFMLGAGLSGADPYTGRIAEVLVYNRALSATEREQIEAALAAKYIAADSDADGLPDVWERQHLGTLNHGATDDPGATGRTLLQSYQQARSPWPAPVVASGLQAWYRADLGVTQDGNNKVSQWVDISGHGGHLIKPGSTDFQPVAVSSAMNGHPAVEFAASSYSTMGTAGPVDLQAGQSDLTVLVVLATGATQGGRSQVLGLSYDINVPDSGFSAFQYWGEFNRFKLSWRNAARDTILYGPGADLTPGQAQVLEMRKAGTSATVYLDGELQGTETVGADMWTPLKRFMVGGGLNGTDPYTGRIAEVLVYNRALVPSERRQIETALMAKYVALNPTNDTDSDGLLDLWEDQYLGTRSYGASADPGGVARTLLQSYQLGLSPWPAPLVTEGLRTWYRADAGVTKDEAGKVTQWVDASGHGHHEEAITPSLRPSFAGSAIGGQPVLAFDGSVHLNSPEPISLLDGAAAATVIAVLKPAATQVDDATILGWGSNGFQFRQRGDQLNNFGVSWYSPSFSPYGGGGVSTVASTPQLVSVVLRTGAEVKGYRNGVLKVTETDTSSGIATAASTLQLGNLDGDGYQGQLAEILVYNRALTTTERESIEADLMQKYSLDDVDGDGLPDAWELQKLGTMDYAATADPYNVGRTLLQSYQQNLSPLPAPVVASGLRAWFRADLGLVKDGSDGVTQWRDLSGQGMHVGAQSGGPVFVSGAIGGEPAVEFDGQVQLSSPAEVGLLSGGTAATVIAVIKPSATQVDDATILGWGSNGFQFRQRGDLLNTFGFGWYSPSFSPYGGGGVATVAGTPQLISVVLRTGTDVKGYLNGVLQTTESDSSEGIRNLPSVLQLGNLDGDGYHGQLAEILVYDRALTDTERADVEAALTARYLNSPNPDTDGDDLPDAWELQHFGNLASYIGADDPDGDGLTNLQEYQGGTDPLDYFNGSAPVITVLTGGDGQPGADGLLQVRITNASGTALANAPVSFAVTAGSSQLATSAGGSTLAASIDVRTAADGKANAYYRTPSGQSAAGTVDVHAGATSTQIELDEAPPGGGGDNVVPVISLTAPLDNAVINGAFGIVIAARAYDVDGTITKVEFFADGDKIGESTTFPYYYAWTNPGTGAHTLTATATDNSGAATTSTAVHVTYGPPASALLTHDFETGEGFTTGNLAGQNTWTKSGTVQVTNAAAHSGTQSVVVQNPGGSSYARLPLPSQPEELYIDFWWKPVADTSINSSSRIDIGPSVVGFVRDGNTAELQGYMNLEGWEDYWFSGKTIAVDANGVALEWQHITIRKSSSGGIDVCLNGQPALGSLNTWGYDAFVVTGHALQPTRIDLVRLLADNPCFADADRDGMDDAWEAAHGLDPTVNDRSDDNDGDGLSNTREFHGNTSPADIYDLDRDGLPDLWELHFFGNLDQYSWQDADNDGQTNGQEYAAGTDPTDYFNGATILLTAAGGNNQTSAMRKFAPDPLDVLVTADGQPVPNASIQFTVKQGGGYLAADNGNPGTTATTLPVQTNENGIARAYFLQPYDPDVMSQVEAAAGQRKITFTLHSVSGSEAFTNQALTIPEVTGDNQYRLQGQFTLRALVARVWNGDGSAPVHDVPLQVVVTRGGGLLSIGNTASSSTAETLSLSTDQNGQVKVYYREPAAGGIASEISVIAPGVTRVMKSFSVSRSLATGTNHALALKADGTIWSWGANDFGQLGDGTTTARLSPVAVAGLNDIVGLYAVADQSLALDNTGHLWAWGGGSSYGTVTSPAAVGAAADVADVAMAADRSLLLKLDGTVWLMGRDGSSGAFLAPNQVTALHDIQSVAIGAGHYLALASDGKVWTWGSNTSGQLANGSTSGDPQVQPAPVPDYFLDNVRSVAAGRAHSLALKNDGTVWAWGDNEFGQVGGDIPYFDYTAPRQMAGLADIVAIYAVEDYNVALAADGSVWTWGKNSTGQLGDGTTSNSNPLVRRITGFLGSIAIVGASGHALALTGNGDVWAWGDNAYWQATPSSLPAKVDISLRAAPNQPPETGTPPPEENPGPSADPTGAVRLNIVLPPRFSTL
ncbi:MAG TPA: LamG-like jellyroll fold domain-containing protein [Lacunisphaera sp.]|nr:LamG-like jellyroll fold domain-containing protein [Lacunisphaera sp.]